MGEKKQAKQRINKLEEYQVILEKEKEKFFKELILLRKKLANTEGLHKTFQILQEQKKKMEAKIKEMEIKIKKMQSETEAFKHQIKENQAILLKKEEEFISKLGVKEKEKKKLFEELRKK